MKIIAEIATCREHCQNRHYYDHSKLVASSLRRDSNKSIDEIRRGQTYRLKHHLKSGVQVTPPAIIRAVG